MSDLKFNPEILSEKPTHTLHGIKVKVFMTTLSFDGTVTFEYMEGEDEGKWSNNAKLQDLIPV